MLGSKPNVSRKKSESKYKDDVIRLRKEGKNYKEIVNILGCCYYTARHYSIENNMPVKRVKKDWQDLKNRNREFIKDYLKSHPCVDCGNSDLRVLDFDHVRGQKLASVTVAVRNYWSIDKIKKEIDKCEIRCSNCHRIVTHERRLASKIKTNNN